MSSVFATYAYDFDKNGNVITSNRTEWSYGRFGRFQGYGTSFSYTLNNDTWKKWKAFFTGEKADDDGREMGKLIRIVKVMRLMILSQVLLQNERKKKLL